MTVTEAMTGAVRATEVLGLERTYALEQCKTPNCDAVAAWRFTTLPCECVALLCDQCFKITRRRYEQARERTHAFAPLIHVPCGSRFQGRELGFTFTHL